MIAGGIIGIAAGYAIGRECAEKGGEVISPPPKMSYRIIKPDEPKGEIVQKDMGEFLQEKGSKLKIDDLLK